MSLYANEFTDEIISLIAGGGIGVLRTDTLYGIVARAADRDAVERVFAAKTRTPSKPPISLIGSTGQLFDEYDAATLDRLNEYWPGKNTLILPSEHAPEWLTRGSGSISYRLPADERLRALIAKTGPLIAPSANPEGQPPAMTIKEAKAYFGDAVDFYVDGGTVTDDAPSKLFRMLPDGWERLR